VTFRASYEGKLPVLFASVRSLLTQKVHIERFLIDSGACISCVPAYRARQWGHSNDDPNVKPFEMPGLGCDWKGFIHPFRLGLVDQNKLWVPIGESTSTELVFIENLSEHYGLLGMDVISSWRTFAIHPRKSGGGMIEISI
jgi:hypothetical protein